jgi:heptosyltransferase-1
MDYDVDRLMDILIIKLSAIGDVAQTLPALEAIKRTYPASRITWVVEEEAANILEGHPMIDRVLVSRRKAWFGMLCNPFTFRQGMSGMAQFIRALRNSRYDIAIDFQGLLKSAIVIGLSRAKRKIGFDRTRELSYLFLNERLPKYDIEKHALERYLDVARYLGAKDASPACTLPIESERVLMRARLAALPANGPVVVLNPVARWKTKLWTESKFADLADRLIRERHATVIITGGPADGTKIKGILSHMEEKAVDWSGKTTLKELAALASLSHAFITTDTGPMHIAAAAGAKVIALFGPTAPWRTGPHGPGHEVVRTGLECSPCFQRSCGRKVECMNAISVQDVLSKVPL